MVDNKKYIDLTYDDLKNQHFYTVNGRPSWCVVSDLCDILQDTNMYNTEQLREIIYGFTGKWSHNENERELAVGAAACAEYRHYEFIWQKPLIEKMINYYAEVTTNLKLKEDRLIVEEEEKIPRKRKPRDVGDGIATKLRKMTLEEMLAWERELDVPEDRIEKHKNLPQIGLARMSIGNTIRHILKKQDNKS